MGLEPGSLDTEPGVTGAHVAVAAGGALSGNIVDKCPENTAFRG